MFSPLRQNYYHFVEKEEIEKERYQPSEEKYCLKKSKIRFMI